MKKIKLLSFFLCLAALFVACEDEENTEPIVGSRTVLVYIAANNSLGSSKFDSKDIQEMIDGMKATEGTGNNLLIYYAGYQETPKLIRLIKNGKGEVKQEIVWKYNEQNSVSVDVMKSVFNTAFSNYPANSYGIVFWSHGDGWLPVENPTTRWWGQDGRSYMDISDLNNALSAAPHLDFILFDACFMQSVEVIYELKERTNYIISSPTEIPGPGAPYQKVVPAMFANNTPEIAIAKAYFDYYADEELYEGSFPPNWREGDPWPAGVSVSVVKTAMIEQLANRTAEILPKYIKDGQPIVVSNILCYDRRSTKYYYDFDGLMRSLPCDENEYNAWKSAYDAAVVYWKTTPMNYSQFTGVFSMEGSAGLSTYILRKYYTPSEASLNTYYQSLKWYSAAGWDKTGW